MPKSSTEGESALQLVAQKKSNFTPESDETLQRANSVLRTESIQLKEALVLQKGLAETLQGILSSTGIATIYLDRSSNIQFFTPTTKSLFNIISRDIGRPLSDLKPLVPDDHFERDLLSVLTHGVPIAREIASRQETWYLRWIFPYRIDAESIDGTVITFTEITERKQIAKKLETARLQADSSNTAKSRFLAAASHDLRQPLQALKLVQGMLSKLVEGEQARKLVDRLDHTLAAMSAMLNALLDINQIDAGTVHADMSSFSVNDIFNRIIDEFAAQAHDQGLGFSVVPCSIVIRSDRRLLEQMIRNMLANALKYTSHGRVLLGCRRRAGQLSIEVWDTGSGIPAEELNAIFEEYYQLDNAARERHRGLGLGLSIVQRLGALLEHNVQVRSWPGKGSAFSIDIAMPMLASRSGNNATTALNTRALSPLKRQAVTILVIEDDPEVRDLLSLILEQEGHRTLLAEDGLVAIDMIARGSLRPDLILADYNLPNGLNGLQTVAKLRDMVTPDLPAIILTGDISTSTLRDISKQKCTMRHKPVKAADLNEEIQRLLQGRERKPGKRAEITGSDTASPIVFVVDDDDDIRELIRTVLEGEGWLVEDFASCEAFLAGYQPGREACLLVDAYLPNMSGLALLRRLQVEGRALPSVMITGLSDVNIAVDAMKAGATDFLEKPISREQLIKCVEHAFGLSRDSNSIDELRDTALAQLADLTPRQRQIMDMVVAGRPSKIIADALNISQRTVENHRAVIMKKTGSRSLPALARLALHATPLV